ncbi:YolD-like family protein [Paenibacillus sp. GCM10028914]|uniref:YolD-like family protein n=1 Tax=Paenibacillus sp. GCM10028914 TaxID=3273416 RepID=UPI003609637E
MARAKVPKRPTRDEFVLEELGNQLSEAFQEESEIELTVWGWEETVRGQIIKMDSRTGRVHVTRNGEVIKVPFMDIMAMNYPRD